MRSGVTISRVALVIMLAIPGFSGCGIESDVVDSRPMDWCDGLPPDAACYAAVRAPDSENIVLARAIADRYIDTYPVAGLGWEWEATVLMTGFYELYRVTADARYLQYMRDWMDYNLDSGYFMWSSDSASPALIAAFLFMETVDNRYRDVVMSALQYLQDGVTRTDDGGINHWGAADIPGPTLWLDTLFMVGTMLTRWGEFNDAPAPLDEMSLQIRVFANRLQSEGGLFVHAFNWSSEVDTDIYWGRGNGWVCAAGFDYLRARSLRAETDARALASLTALARAAADTQDPETGLWWIVMNRPGDTYLETSTTALFAYGMARGWRYGLLGDEFLPVIAAAMDGVRSTLTQDDQGRPVVSNVSDPTEAGTFEDYAAIPTSDDLGYGVGSVLLALVETSGLPE